jgi:transcriptional regulator with XRE-family HTH domain
LTEPKGDYSQIFGRRLRELRVAAGLTQKQLAERSGTSSAAISNFEAGNNSPTLGTLVRLAHAIECNVSELVTVLDGRAHGTSKRRKA